jgi:AraC-like DNA-binding protein
MARPTKEPPVASALAPALLRLVHARGADAAVLARSVGLAPSIAADDEATLTPAALDDLLEAASELLGEPFLALSLPDELPLRRYGLAELSARATATLREALHRLARYAPLVHPRLSSVLEEAGDLATWRQSTPGSPRGSDRHAHEYGLAYALSHARRESGAESTPLRAWLAFARPRDIAPLHRFFGTRELSFGHEDSGLVLGRAALDLPMRGHDTRLLVTASELADAALRDQPRRRALAAAVSARLDALLPEADMETVARGLHMSARTLQRRLEDEGTRFSEVLDGVREQRARRLVDDRGLSLGEVGYRLGFADLASFSRAFKRWTGQPPGTWRRRAAP